METARMERLVNKMALHFPRRLGQPTEGAEILGTSIDQVQKFVGKPNIRLTVLGNYPTSSNEIADSDIPNLVNERLAYLTAFANKLQILAIISQHISALP